MLQDFIMWMQEPGKWNDAMVLCGVVVIVSLIGIIVGEKIESVKHGKWAVSSVGQSRGLIILWSLVRAQHGLPKLIEGGKQDGA